ncbi:MAG: hypothetical protein GF311_09080 [Candidatus Lokiarchaeota archaeon]|nr:hypothetical protein [Candidatus Lokiarchaeota archaeon]
MEYIKICGIQKVEDLEICIKYGATAIGFVYNVSNSPRNLSKKRVKELIKETNKRINTVCVIKVKSLKEITETYREIDTDFIQVHSNLDFSELILLPKELKRKLIISKKLNPSLNKNLQHYTNEFFAFLIDSSEGSGKELNISRVRSFLIGLEGTRIILAGGICKKNIRRIISKLNPYGIDLSSSLEIKKGIKSKKKIETFLKYIKKINKNKIVKYEI